MPNVTVIPNTYPELSEGSLCRQPGINISPLDTDMRDGPNEKVMAPKPLTIAITGAGGFLGTELVSILMRHPRVGEIRALYEHRYQQPQSQGPSDPTPVSFVPFVGDLRTFEITRKLVDGADVVVHLAGQGFPSDSINNPSEMVNANITMTGTLLEAMREVGTKRLLFASSGGALYKSQQVAARPFTEDSALELRSTYAVCKVCSEQLITFYQGAYQISPVIMRISNPYGAGQFGRSRQGFFGVALEKSLRGEVMPVWGSLETCKDFLYIGDLMDIFRSFLFMKGSPTGIFNVGSGKGTTLREGIAALQEITGIKLKLELSAPKQSDCRWTVLDIAKLTATTGWKPRTTLNEGLQKVWEEVKGTYRSVYRAA